LVLSSSDNNEVVLENTKNIGDDVLGKTNLIMLRFKPLKDSSGINKAV
jgi:hypothetical protein